jgi:predicted metal-dependent HD superfamily phosphohydrolase
MNFGSFFFSILASDKARKRMHSINEIIGLGNTLASLMSTKMYHNQFHVEYMFRKANELHLRLTQEEKIAIFFHDAINRMTTRDESDSVYIMKGMLNSLMDLGFLKKADLDSAATLIHYTMVKPGMKCGKFGLKITNLDWAILGDTRERYDSYAFNIAVEAARNGYTQKKFKKGRIAFLKNTLKNKTIFTHPAFKRLNKQARANMKAELEKLK